MRRQINTHVYKKYQPQQSFWRRFFGWRQHRKNKKIQTNKVQAINSYKVNPFKTDNKPKKKILFWFKVSLLILILVCWIILLLYFPFFTVKNINIKGLENIKYQDIETSVNKYLQRCKYFPCNNYFLVDSDSIHSKLSKEFAISKLETKKEFPSNLFITLEEQKTALIYDNGQAYYLVDNFGNIIKSLRDLNDSDFIWREVSTSTTSTIEGEATKTVTTTTKIHIPNNEQIQKEYGSFPVIYDKRFKEIQNDYYNSIVPKELVLYLVHFQNNFSKINQGKIKYFVLNYIDDGVKGITTNNWDLLLDFNSDINTQLKNIEIILDKNIPLEYIDLREGSRVYWK